MTDEDRSKMSRFDEDAAMAYDGSDFDELTEQAAAQAILARNEKRLLAIEGVVGAGVSRTVAGDDAIVLYLSDAGARARVPKAVDGIAVLTTITGPIDAYRRR